MRKFRSALLRRDVHPSIQTIPQPLTSGDCGIVPVFSQFLEWGIKRFNIQLRSVYKKFVDEISSLNNQMKATEQYFHVVVLIVRGKMVLPFEPVDEILKCDHSNESY